jgi:uncharacterized protein YdaU (DUF1376 family)
VNYYERHLGDYAKDTGHLSMAEHGAYTLLLDRYYATEMPIPADLVYRVAHARSGGERACVDRVLAEFFVLVDGAYINKRAGLDIARYKKSRTASVENGKLGGRPKSQQNQQYEKPIGLETGSETETQSKAHQTPVTSNQQEQKQKGGKPPALTLPDWLPESAWADWHAFRNQRKGWTHKARELSLATLTKLRTKGHDPTAVIEQSIERGWTGLFEPKNESGNIHAISSTSRKLSAVEQVEQAIRERREREPFGDETRALAAIGHG